MKPHKTVNCDKCGKELLLKKAIMRFPIFMNKFFYFCNICAREFDTIENAIDSEANQIKGKAFREFLNI